MYGIVIDDQAEPYVKGKDRTTMDILRTANQRRGHTARLVQSDPPCLWCDEEVRGWFELYDDEWVDQPLHGYCRAAYAEDQDAQHYV